MDKKFHMKDLIVHRLNVIDHEEIRRHFRQLDKDSRRARFCGTVSDQWLSEYIRSILRYDSIVCGAFANGHLRGIAELRGILPMWTSTAEAAFSVEPDWQDIGIGDALIEHIVTMAQNRLVRSVRLIFQRQNIRMWHLAEKHNAKLHFDQDVVDATLYPYWPTPASMAKEVIGETKQVALLLSG